MLSNRFQVVNYSVAKSEKSNNNKRVTHCLCVCVFRMQRVNIFYLFNRWYSSFAFTIELWLIMLLMIFDSKNLLWFSQTLVQNWKFSWIFCFKFQIQINYHQSNHLNIQKSYTNWNINSKVVIMKCCILLMQKKQILVMHFGFFFNIKTVCKLLNEWLQNPGKLTMNPKNW